jgi:uncharacterized repeat protein (TIGR01451 family)
MSFRGALGFGKKAVASSSIAVLACLVAPEAWANVAAGTSIVNSAQVTYEIAGQPGSAPSNTVTDPVAEVLDLTLGRGADATVGVPTTGLDRFGVPFVLTNTGNGNEAFHVEATPGQDTAPTVAIDVDGNGAYDPAVDITLAQDGTTPVLAPGASLNLLLRFPTAPAAAGTATIRARAVTGSGAPGTPFAGRGDDGVDAIVGQTRAEATLTIPYDLGGTGGPGTPTSPRLTKSQTVRAPDGSETPVQGAVITYRLALTTSGTAAMSDAEIVDPIPAGTAFVPGSIRIEDVAASDVPDADAAHFDGQAIHIALGEISQPTTRVVTFQVTIL